MFLKKEIAIGILKKLQARILKPFSDNLNLISKKVSNRLPDGLIDFNQKKILPYLGIIVIALFTVVANVAQASEENLAYQPSEDVMDLTAADVAKTVTNIDSFTPQVQEDPVTVALAVENRDYLGKPVLAETQITEDPKEQKAPEKRSKTIVYTVDDGDTLSKIAWKYSLKIATIRSANNLSSDTIRPGQRLNLPPQDISASQIANLNKKVAGASTKTPFGGTFRRPTSGWRMTQVFGHTSFESNHTGIDLDWGSGRTLFASASGRVVRTSRGWGGGYGNHIVIDHGSGFQTLYGHMASFSVSQGQWVNQGQAIGIMGSTGWSTGVHVHFEIRVNGTPVNPMKYL